MPGKDKIMNKELFDKLQNAKTDEERKQIIEENKVVLTDEELEQVAGGSPFSTVKRCPEFD